MERAPVLVRHGGQVQIRQLPPGFRFHPTDEELVVQYLRRKALGFPLPAAVIPVVPHLYKLDPWEIPGASEGDKYFFAVRPAGGGTKSGGRRPATASGCWNPAGGRDKPVVMASRCGGNHLVGVKKSMVFALRRGKGKGKGVSTTAPAPAPQTDWVMHEYRLALPPHHNKGCCLAQAGSEEWVVCRIFQKDRSPSRRPGGHGRRHATAAHRTIPMPPSLSASASSSSSCVTSSSDQEEVSS